MFVHFLNIILELVPELWPLHLLSWGQQPILY